MVYEPLTRENARKLLKRNGMSDALLEATLERMFDLPPVWPSIIDVERLRERRARLMSLLVKAYHAAANGTEVMLVPLLIRALGFGDVFYEGWKE